MGLTLVGGQLEDEQVLTTCHRLRVRSAQCVVGDAETRRRKQVVPVAVIGEGARLAHEAVDDVAILDVVTALATQARDALQMPLRVVDVEMVGVQTDRHPLTNQTTVDRVGVVTHPDGAEGTHAHLLASEILQASCR